MYALVSSHCAACVHLDIGRSRIAVTRCTGINTSPTQTVARDSRHQFRIKEYSNIGCHRIRFSHYPRTNELRLLRNRRWDRASFPRKKESSLLLPERAFCRHFSRIKPFCAMKCRRTRACQQRVPSSLLLAPTRLARANRTTRLRPVVGIQRCRRLILKYIPLA